MGEFADRFGLDDKTAICWCDPRPEKLEWNSCGMHVGAIETWPPGMWWIATFYLTFMTFFIGMIFKVTCSLLGTILGSILKFVVGFFSFFIVIGIIHRFFKKLNETFNPGGEQKVFESRRLHFSAKPPTLSEMELDFVSLIFGGEEPEIFGKDYCED